MFGVALCAGIAELASSLGPPPPSPEGEARGATWLVEDSLPVHAKVELELVYEAGEGGLDPGDRVAVEEPIFHGIRWAKWGYLSTSPSACTPLSEDQESASVGTVLVGGPQGVELSLEHSVDGPGIHDYGLITAEVVSGRLEEGEEVRFRLGVDEGDCGWQTSRRAFTKVPLRVYEYVDGAEEPALVGEPTFSFDPEEAVSVHVTAPSQALAGQPFAVRVAPIDRHGNLAAGEGVELHEVVIDEPGIHRPTVAWGEETWTANPVRVGSEAPELAVYWGDLHTHHGHSYLDDEGDWVDENHAYARDVAGLDFASESVKAGEHELYAEDLWERQQRACAAYTDGSYVALLGFEWMGDMGNGHHNVYYASCDGPLGDDAWEALSGDLWGFVEGVAAEHGPIVTIPHATSYTGYNWRDVDDELRPVAEVYSEWGSSMDEAQSGSVPDGLRAGNRMGLLASSDNHDGWLGNGLAWRTEYGGLAAVRAEALDAEGLLSALQARRTHATTGERILLEVGVSDGAGEHLAGEAWSAAGDATLSWSAAGTAAIEMVRVLVTSVGAAQDSGELAVWTPGELDASGSVLLPRAGSTLIAWVEVEQEDGERAWSSPVWIEPSGSASRGCGVTGASWWFLPALWLVSLRSRRGS